MTQCTGRASITKVVLSLDSKGLKGCCCECCCNLGRCQELGPRLDDGNDEQVIKLTLSNIHFRGRAVFIRNPEALSIAILVKRLQGHGRDWIQAHQTSPDFLGGGLGAHSCLRGEKFPIISMQHTQTFSFATLL